jgi:hypothetical protein
MLSPAKEIALQSLLARSNLSEREIASTAGVARGTVRSRKAGCSAKVHAVRCECGALVIPPCKACQLRRSLGKLSD